MWVGVVILVLVVGILVRGWLVEVISVLVEPSAGLCRDGGARLCEM